MFLACRCRLFRSPLVEVTVQDHPRWWVKKLSRVTTCPLSGKGWCFAWIGREEKKGNCERGARTEIDRQPTSLLSRPVLHIRQDIWYDSSPSWISLSCFVAYAYIYGAERSGFLSEFYVSELAVFKVGFWSNWIDIDAATTILLYCLLVHTA